jgi:hypothetical protein
VSYWDLGGFERGELADVWAALLGRLRVDCASRLEEYFEELEDVKWGKKKRAEICDAAAEVVVTWMRSSEEWAEVGPPALADFVEELERRGWRILDPGRADRFHRVLADLREVTERLEVEKLRTSKPRHPRMKRLKEA